MQKFKILDNGIVSFSNPARQNLYTFEDCLSGETFKVNAAASAMTRIDPTMVWPPFLQNSLHFVLVFHGFCGVAEVCGSMWRHIH